MIFREIKKEDIPFIISSASYGFNDGWNEEMLLSSFSTQRFGGIIASLGNEDVGYITFDLGIDDADIEEVFVLPKYRKQGVALALVNEVFLRLKEKGTKKIFLEVRENNILARKLYEKRGFSKINERKKYYFDGETAVVYLKEL